jgi:hypothetical protein
MLGTSFERYDEDSFQSLSLRLAMEDARAPDTARRRAPPPGNP